MKPLWYGAWPLLRMVAGLALWLSCFGLLYAGLSLACTYGLPATHWLLLGSLAVHLLALGWLTRHSWRACRGMLHNTTAAQRFVLRITGLANTAALLATLYLGMPILMTAPCL